MYMNRTRAITVASVPAALGLAWHRYRKAIESIAAHPAVPPALPGVRRQIDMDWGTVAYRWVQGDPERPALVFLHGWGKTADSTWWPIVPNSDRSMALIDLPGHGMSRLHQGFTFELAAETIHAVVDDTGIDRPVLVAHSMGGPVAFSAIRDAGPDAFAGLVAMATSAYWVRPRLWLMMAMAPYAMAPRSPFLVHRERSDLRRTPDQAHHIAWAYTRRPLPGLLREAAIALRRFDARAWPTLELPPTTWVVTSHDRVLPAKHQLASAEFFGADVIELEAEHPLVVQTPGPLREILDRVGV